MLQAHHLLFLLGLSHHAIALPKLPSSGSLPSVSLSGPPVVSHPASLPHTPYRGTPTITGALSASSVLRSSITPGATDYPSDGKLHDAEPAPYVPAGGVGTSGEEPVYNAKSDFDFESLVCSCIPIALQYTLEHVLMM